MQLITILSSIAVASMAHPALAAGGNNRAKTKSKTPMLDSLIEHRSPIFCLVQMCEMLDGGKKDCTRWYKVYPGGSHTFQEDGRDTITVTFDNKCKKSLSGSTKKRSIGFPTQVVYRSDDPILAGISKIFEPGRAPSYH